MVKCDKTNRRKTLDEFALEAEGNEEEASLSLFDLLCIGIGGTRRGRTVACSRWNSKPPIRPVRSTLKSMSRMMTKQVSALSPTCSGRLPGSRGAEVGGLRKETYRFFNGTKSGDGQRDPIRQLPH